MQAVHGYYDGVTIQPMGKIIAKPNQRVIITVLDEFMEPEKNTEKQSIRGILSQYANPALIEKEKGAWERAAVEKYGNA